MREALAAIRAELGADAVMLSSRKLPTGVEVIAAIDYDDSLFQAPREGAAPAPGAARAAAAVRGDADVAESGGDDLDEYERAAAAVRNAALQRAVIQAAASREAATRETSTRATATRETLGRPAPSEQAAASTGAARKKAVGAIDDPTVADEIKDLRRLLETQLASLAWNDLNRDAPVRARLLREMAKFGIDAGLAQKLAAEIPSDLGAQEALRALVRRFGEALPLAPADLTDRGGVFAFVGPTGVGKTTTIAKIAARFVLRHGVDALGLVSTDTYRVGARQQLSNYARILRAPLHVAETSDELRRILDGFQHKKLVLIDTAGMSQRDVRLANQFATLRVPGHRVETVLVLSAGADRGCLAEALRVFQSANPESLVITKLDEAAALGGVLSLAIHAGVPIAYLADGQRVPEDLHLAAPKRFWLMHSAVKLTQSAPLPLDENELAANFGEMELATHA
jgi:flagellar biosynthesis protein FlhF